MAKETEEKMSVRGRPREFDRDVALEKALNLFWQHGYEPTSLAMLCSELGIRPPSFYAAFTSKEALFIEAIHHYDRKYWTKIFRQLEESNAPLSAALTEFFERAVEVLVNPEHPRGCMVVIAATNLSAKEERIATLMKTLRRDTRAVFLRRLRRAQTEKEFRGDPETTADALNIFLEGMSVQARDGISKNDLLKTVRLVPLLLTMPSTGLRQG